MREALADRSRHHSEHDRLLTALIRLAQLGEVDAGAVVVCCLRPGLVKRAPHSGHGLGREDALAEMVAALWEQILSYPIDSQPEYIASRLLTAATQQLRNRARAERRHCERTRPLRTVDLTAIDDAEPLVEVLLSHAVVAGIITATDAGLIMATDLDGMDLRSVGLCRGLRYDTAKKRRQRARARLAAWLSDPPTTSGDNGHLEEPA